jgi:prevent-host-death family protein
MRAVNVAELRSRLSAYLGRVRAGEEILISDRNLAVAKIVPLSKTGNFDWELPGVGAAGWGPPVQMTSAFARLCRKQEIDQQDFRLAMTRLTELHRRWIEVQPTEVLRDLAEMLLQRHPLRAADVNAIGGGVDLDETASSQADIRLLRRPAGGGRQ